MNKKWLIVPVLIVVALGALYLKKNGYISDENQIFVSGNIEITEVDISFKIPGRVEKRLVSEGDRVTFGQTVAILDSVDLEQEVALREAELQGAKAVLRERLHGYLPEQIAQAEAKAKQTAADLSRYDSDYTRQKQLYEKGAISEREFEVSVSAYERAKAAHREAKENLVFYKRGFRDEKIDQAIAEQERAKQALNIAKTRQSYAKIISPIQGYVLSENIEPGEYVTAGTPIVTIGGLENVWLRAYVDETDLGRVKLGQLVEVTTDTYPDKIYKGKVTFISQQAEFTPKNVQTQKERVKLVYRIKIDIPNPNMELKAGMPADGLIITTDEHADHSIETTH